MTEWVTHDDAGYLAWLAANSDGFVINCHIPPNPGYMILHRAACRTINRDLPSGRSWTRQYGKACAPTAEELVAWSVEQTGTRPSSCGICGGDGVSVGEGEGSVSTASAVSPPVEAPTFEGEPIRVEVPRMDGGPPLVLDGAQWLAELFFRFDASAIGPRSYDAWTIETKSDRFEEADIAALNRTMAARTSAKHWKDLFTEGPSPVLARLPVEWTLFEDGSDAADTSMPEQVGAVISEMRGPYRQLATVTKLLHLKRPALVPVLDSLVIDLLGARGRDDTEVVAFVQQVGRANLGPLREIQRHLEDLSGWDGRPIERTLVRILDGLVWSAHPASVMYPLLARWRTRMEVTP